jgi:hypothetical protein
VFNAPSFKLGTLTTAWPFAKCGIDLLGPFHKGVGQVKFLIVVVDYFTKWIEVEPLAKITTANAIKFFQKNILSIFGVPQEVITDNGTQFAGKRMRELMKELNSKQHFTSVEHPHMNGQVESSNKVILRGLKRILEEAKGSWPEELPHVL